MKTGIELIQQEREEQLVKHKRTIKQDVFWNKKGELSFAAALMCCPDPEEHGNAENKSRRVGSC